MPMRRYTNLSYPLKRRFLVSWDFLTTILTNFTPKYRVYLLLYLVPLSIATIVLYVSRDSEKSL